MDFQTFRCMDMVEYDRTFGHFSVADPGFPIGGCGPVRGGRGPLTWMLFGKNVCKNERIGSIGGMRPACPPQGWIQDFLLGGHQPSLEGAPTSDTGAFW